MDQTDTFSGSISSQSLLFEKAVIFAGLHSSLSDGDRHTYIDRMTAEAMIRSGLVSYTQIPQSCGNYAIFIRYGSFVFHHVSPELIIIDPPTLH